MKELSTLANGQGLQFLKLHCRKVKDQLDFLDCLTLRSFRFGWSSDRAIEGSWACQDSISFKWCCYQVAVS